MQFWFFIIFAFTLSACTSDEVAPLPIGPQSVQGVLRSTDISLVRRGSHLLYQDGVEHAYVESAKVNLRSYENQMVTLSGSYQPNTEPIYLPVFIVDAVSSFEETTKEWLLPALGLTLETPREWIQSSSAGKVHFAQTIDAAPVLTLYTQVRPQNEEDLPKGVSIVIDGLPAIRMSDDQTGGQTIYVLHPTKLLTLVYAPPVDTTAELLRADWLQILASITFNRSVQIPRSSSASISGAGGACGGPAGILCPSGQYCEITDVANDIGLCRGL